MKKLTGIMILGLAALAIASCGGGNQETVVEEKAVSVTVAPASISDIAISRTYTGTLEGWRQARIYASIPEAVVELPVKEGSEVQAGQAVIILDKGGSASRVRQAEAVYQEAKDNFDKMSRLYQQGAISEQTYNNLRTNLDVAKANYEAARQQVELTSPITGLLTDLSVNIGQYVPLGTPLATVAQTDRMRLTIFVDGRSASFLREGQDARVSVAAVAATDSDFEGTVTEVARSADPETRLFRVELRIDNNDRKLSPGMFARATIVVRELDDVLTIPREALFFTEGLAKVFTIDDSCRAREQSIEVGESTLEKYQVVSGLNSGENVIVLGRNLVESGGLVRIMEDTSSVSIVEDSRER
jgi:RND family efflux transporter MFP subunit